MRCVVVVPLLLVACESTWHDPEGTGIRLRPPEGRYKQCQHLEIQNRLPEDVQCEVYDHWEGSCDEPLGWDQLIKITNLEVFDDKKVCCADVDINCHSIQSPEGEGARAWSWRITAE